MRTGHSVLYNLQQWVGGCKCFRSADHVTIVQRSEKGNPGYPGALELVGEFSQLELARP